MDNTSPPSHASSSTLPLNSPSPHPHIHHCLHPHSFPFETTERQVIIGHQEEMEIIDRQSLIFNSNLKILRTASLVLMALGFVLLVCVLVLPTLIGVRLGWSEPSPLLDAGESDESQDSRVYVKVDQKDRLDEDEEDDQRQTGINSPPLVSIPAVEKIRSVQPQRESAESILTSGGFAPLSK